MKITKIKIKNLFGIKEFEASGKDCEILGCTGSGKTSIIDALRLSLTNKSFREVAIKEGESEGSVYFETDTAISVERVKRRDKIDVTKVTDNGKAVKAPESFLRELFTTLQLDPIEFIRMDSKEQNRIILDLIDFKWDLNWIKEQFGEIVPDVNYEQNILRVLFQIQADDGHYFLTRQDINRDIRNNKAFIEEIGAVIPANYNVKSWEKLNLSDLYTKIEKIRQKNNEIQKAKQIVESFENKARAFEADKEIALNVINRETSTRRSNIEQSIIKLKAEINAYETELKTLEEKKIDKVALVEKEFEVKVAGFKSEVEQVKPLSTENFTKVSDLEDQAKSAEHMKSFINEYERMIRLQGEVAKMVEQSEFLTAKIEKARTLPGEILEKCKIPVAGLTIVDGEPRIKGLPVSNLSDGEKLALCIDIACQKKSALNLLLIDGVEKLDKKNREILYASCKKKKVQFLATRTTDQEELIVVEL